MLRCVFFIDHGCLPCSLESGSLNNQNKKKHNTKHGDEETLSYVCYIHKLNSVYQHSRVNMPLNEELQQQQQTKKLERACV